MPAHGIHDTDHALARDDSGILLDAVVAPFVQDQVVVLVTGAGLDYLRRNVLEAVPGV